MVPAYLSSASQVAQWVKNPPATQETQEMQIQFLGQEDPLEEGTATHSNSCLENLHKGAWRATIHRVASSQTRSADAP